MHSLKPQVNRWLLSAFCCLSTPSFAEESAFALVRPWVAEQVMLSEEQKAQVRTKVVLFQSAMREAADKYPLGGQDKEGTLERNAIEKAIRAQHVRIGVEIRSLLNEEQLELFRKLMPTFPKQSVTFEQREMPPETDAADEPTRIVVVQKVFDLFNHERHPELKSLPPKADLTPVKGLKSMATVGNAKPVFWHEETERILAGAISPNERFAVTLGSSAPGVKRTQELRLWDAKTGELLDILVINGVGESCGRSGSVRFLSSDCVLLSIEPFGR